MLVNRIVMLIVLAVAVIICPSNLSSELILKNWKTFTSLANVQSADKDSRGRIWAGTTGGIFIYNPANGDIKEIRNTEGLNTLNITTVKFNPADKKIYTGAENGYIQIATEDLEWEYVTDILNSKLPNPKITDILFMGDEALISGGFGLTKFDLVNKVIIETAIRFGDLSPNTKVNDLLVSSDNYIWAGTDEGIAKLSATESIANPDLWNVITTNNGLPDNIVTKLVEFKETIFASTDNNIVMFGDTGISVLRQLEEWEDVTGLFSYRDTLAFANQFSIHYMNKTVGFPKFPAQLNTVVNMDEGNSDELLVFLKEFGFLRIVGDDTTHIVPNSPNSNNFADLDVDIKGRLWAATQFRTADGYKKGFMMMDGEEKWKNFDTNVYSFMTDNCLKVKGLPNGRVFVSTWGRGLYIVSENDTGFVIDSFSTTNSPLVTTIGGNPYYAITSEVLTDNMGVTWIINYAQGYPGPVLIAVDNKGEFTAFENRFSNQQREYHCMTIDQWGTKWLGADGKLNSYGLYYINENGTLKDQSDDKYGRITTSLSEDLLDDGITALATDKSGFIWIGTNTGLNYIYDSSPALTGNMPIVRQEKKLETSYINDIYVDALNNKWIATTKGVWVLNEDGSEFLNSKIINSSNSPLIADEVMTITSNQATGVMYFGTKNGLSAAQTLSAKPSEKYDIVTYPQPFNPGVDTEMIIDGLEENSDIRILTVDGDLVKSLSAKGKFAYWDGRDELGEIAKNGVYIIVGSSETTGQGAYGKFAILRK